METKGNNLCRQQVKHLCQRLPSTDAYRLYRCIDFDDIIEREDESSVDKLMSD
jgi:hypothetical protein